jgi:hypothetical protein
MVERDNSAERGLPAPARAGQWLLSVGVGVGTFLVALAASVIVIRAIPVTTNGADSKADFAEWVGAMQVRAVVALGLASLAATVAGAIAFRFRRQRPTNPDRPTG